MIVRSFIFGFVFLCAGTAKAQTLSQIIPESSTTSYHKKTMAEIADRERRFRQERDEWAKKLAALRLNFDALQARADADKARIIANKDMIDELYEERISRLTELVDVYGLTRIRAEQSVARARRSVVYAQYPQGLEVYQNMQRADDRTPVDNFEAMFVAFKTEHRAQREVSRFTANVRVRDNLEEKEVIRIGSYIVFTPDGQYLLYDEGLHELYQPKNRTKGEPFKLLRGAASSKPGETVYVAIDPSRGRLLDALLNR